MRRALRWMAGWMLLVPTLYAADASSESSTDLNAYLQQLSVTLQHTAQRVNQPNAEGSSVVGLRGSKPESTSQRLYWKGVEGPAPITVDEVKRFRGAIEQARAGQIAEAVKELQVFEKQYPKSALLPDVEKARTRLADSSPS